MEILKGVRVKDLGLIVSNSLIITDVHIGLEEALNKQGVLIPRFQFKELIERMEKIFSGEKFDRVIVAGDLKHEFGLISKQEWRHTLQFLTFLKKYVKEIVLIKGNHDKILGPIAEMKGISVVESYSLGDHLILHGNKIPDKIKEKVIIIGHEHPAVSIAGGPRVELFKCFLKGKWKRKDLIVIPSFNLVSEGTDVTKEGLLSPFLKQDLSNFEVYVVADEIRYFGTISNLCSQNSRSYS
ncbi:metallophosphoesterase [Nanoarchaeota archaeon]